MQRNLLLLFHTASLPQGIDSNRLPSLFNGCGNLKLANEAADPRFHVQLSSGDAQRLVTTAKFSRGLSYLTPVIVAGENSALIAEAQKQNVRLIILPEDANIQSLQTSVAEMQTSVQAASIQPARAQTTAPALL